jgi:hypothetical protein
LLFQGPSFVAAWTNEDQLRETSPSLCIAEIAESGLLVRPPACTAPALVDGDDVLRSTRFAVGDLGFLLVYGSDDLDDSRRGHLWSLRTDGLGRAVGPPHAFGPVAAGYAVTWTDDAFGVLYMPWGNASHTELRYQRVESID